MSKYSSASKDIVKKRILLLMQYFYEHTDEDHQVSTPQLLEYLEKQKTPANRKTLKNDIDTLQEVGVDIVVVPSKPNRYFLGDRGFELPELKLLIDAVSSSRFITQKKSKELSKKLASFASVNQREELDRHIYATNRVKSSNEAIYYSVDTINEAISKRKKITFQYIDYDGDKKRVLKHDGETYELSPYALFWNEDYYYVVGWSKKHEKVSAFRVDRLYMPEILDERAVKKPKDYNLEDYSKQIFNMFDGEDTKVRLQCKDEFMVYIIDRFGQDVQVARAKDKPGYFVATVDVALSPTFYAWVFQFGGEVKILSPKKAIKEIVDMAATLIEVEGE